MAQIIMDHVASGCFGTSKGARFENPDARRLPRQLSTQNIYFYFLDPSDTSRDLFLGKRYRVAAEEAGPGA